MSGSRFLVERAFCFASLCLLFLFGTGVGHSDALEDREQRIMAIIEDFKSRLDIAEEIRAEIVPWEKRLVSVRRFGENREAFLIRFDENFLTTLGEEELRAAVAHEMGHVWIFTRRPYLHTETLANRKALLLVSNECLEKLYMKVAEFGRILPELQVTDEAEYRTTPLQDRGLH